MTSGTAGFLASVATLTAAAAGLAYLVGAFFPHPGDPASPLAVIAVVIVLGSELAAGTFAGASVAWFALTRDELPKQARIGVAAFVLVTVASWIAARVGRLAGILLPLEVYSVLAVILIFVACRADYSREEVG